MNPASTSVPSPTLIPLRPKFPLLLPTPPQPHLLPLAPRSWRKVRLGSRRDINNELAQLSEEETEIEEQLQALRTRGSTFLVPIGKTMTLQEEKNDAATETTDGGSEESEGTGGEEGDNAESGSVEQDLDASLEDMDAQDEHSEGDEEADPDTSGFSMEADPAYQTSSPPMR